MRACTNFPFAMKLVFCLQMASLLTIVFGVGGIEDVDPSEERLSSRIREVIAYYQENGAVLVPASDIPNPLRVPDMVRQIGATPVSFKDTLVYGLQNLTVEHVNTDIEKMQVFVTVWVDRLVITGNHSTSYWFTKVGGEYNLTLLDVEANGAAALKIKNGEIFAEDSNLEMSFRESLIDLKNQGAFGSVLKGVLSSSKGILFDGMKPTLLREVREKIVTRLNEKLKKLGKKFNISASKTLVQMAVEEGRRYIKHKGYDPYHVGHHLFKYKSIRVRIPELVLEGLSNFHKVGNVTLFLENGMIHLGVQVATFGLKGGCNWNIDLGNGFVKNGSTVFTVLHFQVKATILQSVDVRKRPYLDDLDLNVGPIIVQTEGIGTLDNIISLAVAKLPHYIRLVIVDAIEEPLRIKIQKIFDKIDVEKNVESYLPRLDTL